MIGASLAGWSQRDECVAVFYLGQLSVQEQFGEASAVLGLHHAVSAGPDHEGGAAEARLPVGPGGKLSNASHEARTTLPTRAAPSQMSSWTSAPLVSLPPG